MRRSQATKGAPRISKLSSAFMARINTSAVTSSASGGANNGKGGPRGPHKAKRKLPGRPLGRPGSPFPRYIPLPKPASSSAGSLFLILKNIPSQQKVRRPLHLEFLLPDFYSGKVPVYI